MLVTLLAPSQTHLERSISMVSIVPTFPPGRDMWIIVVVKERKKETRNKIKSLFPVRLFCNNLQQKLLSQIDKVHDFYIYIKISRGAHSVE